MMEAAIALIREDVCLKCTKSGEEDVVLQAHRVSKKIRLQRSSDARVAPLGVPPYRTWARSSLPRSPAPANRH